MAFLLMILALAAAAGAAALWKAAARQDAARLSAAEVADAATAVDAADAAGTTDAVSAQAASASDAGTDTDTVDGDVIESAVPSDVVQDGDMDGELDGESDEEDEESGIEMDATREAASTNAPFDETETETKTRAETKAAATATGADSALEQDAGDEGDAVVMDECGDPTAESSEEPTDVDMPAPSGSGPSLLSGVAAALPGAVRRERREWAEERGYDYAKSDEYLVDEFTRGAASSGHAPREIVAGHVLGHEMLLMDIGGVGVMAMRTGATSDVVVDFRREGVLDEPHSDDLIPVSTVAGFTVFATDAAVVERFIDARVITALEALPAEVTAAWLESEWALAQTTKAARSAQWDALQAPLALLADAARVLPPRSQAAQVLRLGDGDPTRMMDTEAATLASGPVLVAPAEDTFERPAIQRPEEPMELPTRMVSTYRGPVRHRALGADEVDAIADGNERPEIDGGAPRVRRNLDGDSSIFDDGR